MSDPSTLVADLTTTLDREETRLNNGYAPHLAGCGRRESIYGSRPIPCDCGEPERKRAQIAKARRVIERHAPVACGCQPKCGAEPYCEHCCEDAPCVDLLDEAAAWGVTPCP